MAAASAAPGWVAGVAGVEDVEPHWHVVDGQQGKGVVLEELVLGQPEVLLLDLLTLSPLIPSNRPINKQRYINCLVMHYEAITSLVMHY